jgi:hypothetical protein
MRLPLERLQSDFAAALIDPARARVLEPACVGRADRTLERLALYRANIRITRERALANAYPVVRALVGDEFFARLAGAYVHAHPDASGDLNDVGARLAQFLGAFEPARSLPYLADVAALEWSVHRAARAADATAVARHRIARLPPADLLSMRFGLHPACAWIESEFPVASIWLAHQPGTTVALPAEIARSEVALVVRPRWHAQVLLSSAGEVAALARLQAGADMEHAIGAALRADAGFNFARALVRWLDYAVLVEMTPAT